MECRFECYTERQRAEPTRPALFLSVNLPVFTQNAIACQTANEALSRLAKAVSDYMKTDLTAAVGRERGARYPMHAKICVKVHRMDEALLSLEMITQAEQRKRTVYERHIYLHFGDAGSLPLRARAILRRKLDCFFVRDDLAVDPLSGKTYAIKEKYKKKK